MNDFFSSTLWIVITALLSIGGFFTGVFGIYLSIRSSKEVQGYKYLFRIAGQHIDLEDKTTQINDYEKQIVEMRKTINEQIPEEARKIALSSILENEIKVLESTYDKVKSLQSHLDVLSYEDFSRAKELMKGVSKAIEPAYSQKRFNSLLGGLFCVISIVSSALSIIMPLEIYKLIMMVVLLIQLFISIKMIGNILKLNYPSEEIIRMPHKAYYFIAIVFWIASLVFLRFADIFFNSKHPYFNVSTFFILSAVSYAIYLMSGIVFLLKENRKNLRIWLSLSLVGLIQIIIAINVSSLALFVFGVCMFLVAIVFFCRCGSKKRVAEQKQSS